MTTKTIPSLENSVVKTNQWFDELAEDLGRDREYAYHALRAVLHALRDRMTVEEASDLAAQLPMLVRGFYYESWNPVHTPTGERSREAFLQHIAGELGGRAIEDGERLARAVFALLDRHCTSGQVSHVKWSLPKEVQELWPA